MRKGRSITLVYEAVNASTGAWATGDSANHTLRWFANGAATAPSNAPSEIDATNAPGRYKITLTNSECNYEYGVLMGKSSTANVQLSTVHVHFEDDEPLQILRTLKLWIDYLRGQARKE